MLAASILCTAHVSTTLVKSRIAAFSAFCRLQTTDYITLHPASNDALEGSGTENDRPDVLVMRLRLFAQLAALLLLLSVTSSFSVPSSRQQTYNIRLHSAASSQFIMSDPTQPWYSHSDLKRDRSHVLDSPLTIAKLDSSRFVVVEASRGMYHRIVDVTNNRSEAEPLFLSYQELERLIGPGDIDASFRGDNPNLIAWVGHFDGSDFFVCHLKENIAEVSLVEVLDTAEVQVSNLRNFGDRLSRRMDAAILSTSNGLVEFHKSHPFCAKCGSLTKSAKVGACRKCTVCKSSFYPRIDVAAIMLITCQDGNYALLGRKAEWSKGRYSTLAGFCEVGETLEHCCAREVFEESGVEVNLNTIRFTCSQPWPFPRSLMAGFREKQSRVDLIFQSYILTKRN
ncbi:NAD+ diphosphatase [Fragilaria crotonensis]|nr:NAD+ diphosphatase [Fragilaria crotonensis]